MSRGSVNQVVLVGNLGADPDMRFTPSGTQVTTTSLATDETWTDRNGETQHRAEWHRLVLWGRLAEIARQYWQKGARVHVEGRLQTRSWEDARGERHYVTEVVVSDMHMPDSIGGPGELDLQYRTETPGEQSFESQVVSAGGPDADEMEEDGLPF